MRVAIASPVIAAYPMPQGFAEVPRAPLAGEGLPVSCPVCPAKVRLAADGIGACAACGSGLLALDDRVLPVQALAARIEAADLPRLVAASLRARKAPRHARLTEVVRLELPYWAEAGGGLVAAFPTAIAAARRLEGLAAEASPGRVTARPLVVPAVAGAGATAEHGQVTSLVLVPAFTVRYEVRGRLFHAIVEACSGHVLAGLHPHPLTVRVHVAMAAVLAVDVAAFALIASLAPNNLIRPVFVAGLGAFVYAFTAFAFRLRERGRPS